MKYKGTATFTQFPTGTRSSTQSSSRSFRRTRTSPLRSTSRPSHRRHRQKNDAIPNWDVEFDISHMTWSKFRTSTSTFVTTPAAKPSPPAELKDSEAYRLGANRRIDDMWDVRFGVVYDKNPQPDRSLRTAAAGC